MPNKKWSNHIYPPTAQNALWTQESERTLRVNIETPGAKKEPVLEDCTVPQNRDVEECKKKGGGRVIIGSRRRKQKNGEEKQNGAFDKQRNAKNKKNEREKSFGENRKTVSLGFWSP